MPKVDLMNVRGKGKIDVTPGEAPRFVARFDGKGDTAKVPAKASYTAERQTTK